MTTYLKSNDMAMDYENLAKDVFKCGRAKDPWGYANADVAANVFVPHGDNSKAKAIISKIIEVKIAEIKNAITVKKLQEINADVLQMNNPQYAMDFIYRIIDVLNEIE